MKQGYIALDIETTGLSCERDSIIEIGAVVMVDGRETARFSQLIQPDCKIPKRIVELTNITSDMLAGAPTEREVMEQFLDFLEKETIEFAESNWILGHNIMFDYSFLKTAAARIKKSFECKGIDTLKLSRLLHPEYPSKTLESMCDAYGIKRECSHRALEDAIAAAQLYEQMKLKFFDTNASSFCFQPLSFTPKKQEPMTAKQRKYLMSLCQAHHLDLPAKLDEFTKSQASRFIDRMILENGLLPHK